jgi:hypothetical protein
MKRISNATLVTVQGKQIRAVSKLVYLVDGKIDVKPKSSQAQLTGISDVILVVDLLVPIFIKIGGLFGLGKKKVNVPTHLIKNDVYYGYSTQVQNSGKFKSGYQVPIEDELGQRPFILETGSWKTEELAKEELYNRLIESGILA